MLTDTQSNVSPGPHKVKFHGMGEDWDIAIENEKDVDVSLVLPQHRARTQPLDYRMNMHVASEGDVKVKVVSAPHSRWRSHVSKLTHSLTSAAL